MARYLLGVSLASSTRAAHRQTWTSHLPFTILTPTHKWEGLCQSQLEKNKPQASTNHKPPRTNGGQCPPSLLCTPWTLPAVPPLTATCTVSAGRVQLCPSDSRTPKAAYMLQTALKAHTPGTLLPPSDTVPPLGGACPGTQAACHAPPGALGVDTQAKLSWLVPPRWCRQGGRAQDK